MVKNSDPWTLRIAYPIQQITKDIGFIFWMSLGLGLLGILFATGASIWIFRRLVDSRLRVLQEFANQVAAGNLTAKLPPLEKDEIGLLVSALAEMTSNLRYILSVAQSSGIELSKTALNMEGTIVELSDLAQTQAASSEEASATVEELNASSETINSNVEQAVTNTKSIQEALLRIQTLMGEITGEVEDFGKIAIQANDKAEEGKNMAGITSLAIAEIQDKSQSITEFSEVISGISEKTSLLALNAAIEAARAGESGRGFAVVAEEISKLASQAADSVSQIHVLTEEAQESIENGGAQVGKLLEVLKEITGEVSIIFQKSQEIIPLIQDQKTRTDHISNEISEISMLIEAIQQSTEEQKRATLELANMTVNISNGSQVLSDQSNVMSESSLKMTGVSYKLGEIMKKFLL